MVEAVGPGVDWVKPGDRVAYCGGTPGSYATERVMPADRLVKVPDGIDDATAATLMLKGLTVQYLFRQTFPLKGGETILFHAAAGGVGLIACQWARALGVTMIGTVGSDEKAELARANGCAHTIVYTREDFVARTKELTGGKGVPVVYDSIGKDTFPQSLDCLSPRGLFVSFGSASGPIAAFNIGLLAQKGSLYATRPTLFSYATDRESTTQMADEMFALVLAGKIRSEARQRFALKDAADAHRALEVARDDRRDAAASLTALAAAVVARRSSGCARRGVSSARAASGSSDAVRPSGPQPCATSASAAAPCTQTATRSAVLASTPCASSAPSVPDRTSPLPAVASAGPPLALMSHVPSG